MSMSEQIAYEFADGEEKEQASSKKGLVLLRLLKMMNKGFYVYVVAIILMSLSMSAFHTIVAFLLKNLLELAGEGSTKGLLPMILKNIGAGLAVLFLYLISFINYQMEAKKGCANLQKKVLQKVGKMPYDYYENTHSGEFMSKLLYDENRTEDVYGSRFRRILMPGLMVMFYLIPMFALSWQVSLCLLGVSMVMLMVNTKFIKPMKKVSSQMSDDSSHVMEKLTNMLSGMEIIKIFDLDRPMVDSYVKENDRFMQGQKKMNRISASLDCLNSGFDLLSSLVFIAVGILFVSINVTTVSDLAAIYVMYGAMNWNMLQIGIYIPSMVGCLTNAARTLDFLDKEEEPEYYSQVKGTMGPGYIEMDKVCFSYDGRQEILHDFNLSVEKGTTVALKGESGRGKSTITKLLLGLYQIKSGKISIGGRALGEIPLKELRGMIGYVPQEPYLYDVSIEENIRYGKPDASKEEIVAAAKAANAHEFILRQEAGYETRAGERGNHLSGGEKQRIAIARAILKNAPILILDEATSALDNESERLVNEALERLMKGRTTIMIAHRPSTLSRADVVVEI